MKSMKLLKAGRFSLALAVSILAHIMLFRAVPLKNVQERSGHDVYQVTFEHETPMLPKATPREADGVRPKAERKVIETPQVRTPERVPPGEREEESRTEVSIEMRNRPEDKQASAKDEEVVPQGETPDRPQPPLSRVLINSEGGEGRVVPGEERGIVTYDAEPSPTVDAAASGEAAGRDSGLEERGASLTARFNTELNRRIEKKKVYPAGARKQGIEGTVVCILEVGPSGTLTGVEVMKSSGSKILDSAAVDLLKKVFPMDNPAARPITLEKAIRYSLVE